MSLFTQAKNESAYLKAGIMGFQGSGKTYTAVELMISLHKHCKSDKPIYMLDSETGSGWAIPKFEEHGIPFMVLKTRAFADLSTGIKEAEAKGFGLIIDSLTHYWNELMESYKKKKGRKRLYMNDWGVIKPDWHELFAVPFVNSKLHIIVCGRAGWEFEDEIDEDGGKELIKTGTKMKAEGEFGYEPSLVIEMERFRDTDKESVIKKGKKVEKRRGKIGADVLHRAHIIKDRTMDFKKSLDGKKFDWKKGAQFGEIFKDIMPHIEGLNLGGSHLGVDTSRTSEKMYESNGEPSYGERKSAQTALLQEIDGVLNMAYPGTAKYEKIIKAAIKKEIFNTYADETISNMSAKVLQQGFVKINALVANLEGNKEEEEKLIQKQKDKSKPKSKPPQSEPTPPEQEPPSPDSGSAPDTTILSEKPIGGEEYYRNEIDECKTSPEITAIQNEMRKQVKGGNLDSKIQVALNKYATERDVMEIDD